MSKVLYSTGLNALSLDTEVPTLDLADVGVSVHRSISDGKSMYHVDVASNEAGVNDLTDYKLKVFIETVSISNGAFQDSAATKKLTTIKLGADGGSHEAEFPVTDGSYNSVELIIRVDDNGDNIWQSSAITVVPALAYDSNQGELTLTSSSRNENVVLTLSGLANESLEEQLADGLTLSLNISEAVGSAMIGGVVTDSGETDEHGNPISKSENTNMNSVDLDIGTDAGLGLVYDASGGIFTISDLNARLGGNYFNNKNDRVFEVIATVMSPYNDNVETVSAIVSPSDHPSNVEGLSFTTEETVSSVDDTVPVLKVKVNANKYSDEDYADFAHGNFEVYYDVVESLAGVESSLLALDAEAVVTQRQIIKSKEDISGTYVSGDMFASDTYGEISIDAINTLVSGNPEAAHYLVLVAVMRPVDASNAEVDNLEPLNVHISRAVHQGVADMPSVIDRDDHRNHALAFNLLTLEPTFAKTGDITRAELSESTTAADSAMNSKQIVVEIPTVTDNNGISGVPTSVSYNISHSNGTTMTDVSPLDLDDTTYKVDEVRDVNGNITATITANSSENHLALDDEITVTPTVTYRNTVESGVALGANVQDQSHRGNTFSSTGGAGNLDSSDALVSEYSVELEPVTTKPVRVVPELHTAEVSYEPTDSSFNVVLTLPESFLYESGSKASEISDVGFGGFKSSELVLKVTIEAHGGEIVEDEHVAVNWFDVSNNSLPIILSGVDYSEAVTPGDGDTEYIMYIDGADVSNNLTAENKLTLTFSNIIENKYYTVHTQFLYNGTSADLSSGVVIEESNADPSFNVVANDFATSLAAVTLGGTEANTDSTTEIRLKMSTPSAFNISELKTGDYNFSWAQLKKTYDGHSIVEGGGASIFDIDDEFLAFPNVTTLAPAYPVDESNIALLKIVMSLYDGGDIPILALHTGEAANVEETSAGVKLVDELKYIDAAHFEGVCLSTDGKWIMVKLKSTSTMLSEATPFKLELIPMFLADDQDYLDEYNKEANIKDAGMSGLSVAGDASHGLDNAVVSLASSSTEYSLSIVTASPIDFVARVNVDDLGNLSASAYIEKSFIDVSYNLDANNHWIDEKGGVLDYIRVELYEGGSVKETKYVKPYYIADLSNNTENEGEVKAYSTPEDHVNDILVEFSDLESGGDIDSTDKYETLINVGIRLVPVVDYDHTSGYLQYNNNPVSDMASYLALDQDGEARQKLLGADNDASADFTEFDKSNMQVTLSFKTNSTYVVRLTNGLVTLPGVVVDEEAGTATLPSGLLELYVGGRRLVETTDYTSTTTGFEMTAEKVQEWYDAVDNLGTAFGSNGVLPIHVKMLNVSNTDSLEVDLNLSVLVSASEGAGHSMDIVTSLSGSTYYYKMLTNFNTSTGYVEPSQVYVTHDVALNHDSNHELTPDSITLHGSLDSAISSSDDVSGNTTVDTSLLYTHDQVSYSITMKTASSETSNLGTPSQTLTLTANGVEVTSGAYSWSQLVTGSLELDFVSVHGNETLTVEVTDGSGVSDLTAQNADVLQSALNGNTYRNSDVTVTIRDDTTMNSIVLELTA